LAAAIPGTHRVVFIKDENADGYRFIGVYALTYVSKSAIPVFPKITRTLERQFFP
jgi:hypothetical protein